MAASANGFGKAMVTRIGAQTKRTEGALRVGCIFSTMRSYNMVPAAARRPLAFLHVKVSCTHW